MDLFLRKFQLYNKENMKIIVNVDVTPQFYVNLKKDDNTFDPEQELIRCIKDIFNHKVTVISRSKSECKDFDYDEYAFGESYIHFEFSMNMCLDMTREIHSVTEDTWAMNEIRNEISYKLQEVKNKMEKNDGVEVLPLYSPVSMKYRKFTS